MTLQAKNAHGKSQEADCHPSVWTHEELKQLVGAIDRGSPKGRRDYAIIRSRAAWVCAARTLKPVLENLTDGEKLCLPSRKQAAHGTAACLGCGLGSDRLPEIWEAEG